MTTNARVFTTNNAHWYYPDARPCYELEKKDGKGMKSPTLADARKLNLLPSVTTILKVLDKPALNDWRVEQGVLAVMTSKQLDGETLDAFIHRVLHVEEVQNQEAATARDRGTAIHNALENYFLGEDVSPEWLPWIKPAAEAIAARGELVAAEKILVGDGFAGKTDLIQESPSCWWVIDWKTTKKLPDPKKGAWNENVLQAAAYAAAYHKLINAESPKPILTANVYVSSIEEGKFCICDHQEPWQSVFSSGFLPLVHYWQWLNDYRAQQ